jgi:hypothetical protein
MTIADDRCADHHQMRVPLCPSCGIEYPPRLVEWAFRDRRRVCEMCKQTRRKQRNPWAVKAQNAIRHHAPRLGIDKGELVTVYGWDPQRLALDAEHQYAGRCNYCGKPYAGMGHGLADITLDIQDPTRPPYYCTNSKWCCQRCNRDKGAMSPEAFEARRQVLNHWKWSKNQLPEQGMLF